MRKHVVACMGMRICKPCTAMALPCPLARALGAVHCDKHDPLFWLQLMPAAVTSVTACSTCESRVVPQCSRYTNGKNLVQEGAGLTAADVCPLGSTQLPLCTACSAAFYLVSKSFSWAAVCAPVHDVWSIAST